MKKLMIAAAAAAMIGGAFALDCGETTDCVVAYKLSLSGKTTVAYTKAYKAPTEDGCGETKVTDCFRKPGSFKVNGYIYAVQDPEDGPCGETGCACFTFEDFDTIFWDGKKVEVTDDFLITQLDLIGHDAKKAEMVATFGNLTLAGFGTYDVKKLELKSVSGNFAGTLAAPKCLDCTPETCDEPADCEETPALSFTLCELSTETPEENTAAFGKWTLKADKSAAKKLAKSTLAVAGSEVDPLVLAPKGFVAAE